MLYIMHNIIIWRDNTIVSYNNYTHTVIIDITQPKIPSSSNLLSERREVVPSDTIEG